MPNMSYCRFQNTMGDLRDCIENLRSLDPADRSRNTCEEKAARKAIILMAAELLNALNVEVDDSEVDVAIDAFECDTCWDGSEYDAMEEI